MNTLLQDVKYAIRQLRSAPAFTIVAVAVLALGIGANTAIFSVISAVLLKPLTYPDPDRIVEFLTTSPQGSGPGASPTKFNVWREQTKVLQDISAYDFGGPGFNLTGGSFPERVQGLHVSANYFRLFGATPVLGRTFTSDEDLPHGGNVVVISYGLWQRRFAGDPQIVGKTISVGSDSYVVTGVIDRNFFTDPHCDLWFPFQIDPNSTNQGHYFFAAGRLKPGVTLAQANAQMKLAAAEFLRKYPGANKQQGFAVQPLRDTILGDVRSSLWVLIIAVGFVLLIACANVANLLLVRATGRKREIAVRTSLGAGRGRIIRQLLTESVLLSLVGGILGVLLGMVGLRALLALSPGDIPRIGENGSAVGLDWRVLLFALGISVLTGILFGMIPAFAISRTDVISALKENSSRSGTSFRQNKTRSILVVTELALALVLLIGAGLLVHTFIAIRGVDPGFDASHVLTLRMSLTGRRFEKAAGVAQLSRDGVERLDALPGVESSAATCCVPLEGGFGLPFTIVGRPTGDSNSSGGGGWMTISPDYFKVFKIPLMRGRFFNDHDDEGSEGVVIINQTLARQFWPKGDPLSDHIVIGHGVGPEFEEGPRRVVGIVGDVRESGLRNDPDPMMYIPTAQVTNGITALNARISPIAWIVRTKVNPESLRAAISRELVSASGGLPVADVRSMDEVVVRSTARENFDMLLLTIFAGSALLLAAIGIYGLMAYSVQQRTQEIGIRMALGADKSAVRNMVVRQVMTLALIGIGIGLAAASGLVRLLASLLFRVKTWDPVSFVVVPVLLIAVALLAVWFPAQNATRVDPVDALRYE
ncbi:MAG TPA: ABC transporter permease [Terriglobales bacterium]|nr:ABC transporter permease [Terriglobales bacterium]